HRRGDSVRGRGSRARNARAAPRRRRRAHRILARLDRSERPRARRDRARGHGTGPGLVCDRGRAARPVLPVVLRPALAPGRATHVAAPSRAARGRDRVPTCAPAVAAELAGRQARRRLLLICFAGVGVTNAVSAIAPGFVVFTGAQVLTRAFVNATLVVAGIAAVEEAPDGARAYALSMLALAYGAG